MPTDYREPEIVHRLKNKVSIALGFTRLLVDECQEGDPQREDLDRIVGALEELLELMPEVAARVR